MLAKQVKALRKAHRMSQSELGIKSGVFNQQEISLIEKGKRKSFKPNELSALAKALGVTLDELASDDQADRGPAA